MRDDEMTKPIEPTKKSLRERGAGAIEYAVLIGAVAIALSLGTGAVGQSTEQLLTDGAVEFADNEKTVANTTGSCPNGWDLIANSSVDVKKKGQDVDANNDGWICRKLIAGLGEGNTGNNTNVKDNN